MSQDAPCMWAASARNNSHILGLSLSQVDSAWEWTSQTFDLGVFTFYVCVESLFDRLVVRGQIESFRIKSNPKVFGYRWNFSSLGKAPSHLDPKLLRQSNGSSYFDLFSLFCGISADPVGGQTALSCHSLLESLEFACPAPPLPARTGGGWLNQSFNSPCVCLVSRRVHLCLPFSQESTLLWQWLFLPFLNPGGGHRVSPVCIAVIFSCAPFI